MKRKYFIRWLNGERFRHFFAHDWSPWSNADKIKFDFDGAILTRLVQYRKCVYCNKLQKREID